MKKFRFITSILVVALTSNLLFSQNKDRKPIEYQFRTRTEFFYVDKHNELQDDIKYRVSDGFRVHYGKDKVEDSNGEEYFVLRYEDWSESIVNKRANLVEKVDGKVIYQELSGHNGINLAIKKSDFEKMIADGDVIEIYSLKLRNYKWLTTGFMTIPFKARRRYNIDDVNFNITTDITLGAYFGPKFRISRRSNSSIIVPLTLGLSYINVENNASTNTANESNSSLVPGITWSSGIIVDLDGFNIGFVFGQDSASGVGEDWFYHKKTWQSFSIGYSFFSRNEN